MTLFQLLRMIDVDCPLKIVDLRNNVLDSVFHKDALNNTIIIRSPLNEASIFSNFSEKKKKFSSWRIFSYFDASCDRIA